MPFLGFSAQPPNLYALVDLLHEATLLSESAVIDWPADHDALVRGCRDTVHALEHVSGLGQCLVPKLSDFLLVPQTNQRGVHLSTVQLLLLGCACHKHAEPKDWIGAAANVLSRLLEMLPSSKGKAVSSVE